MAGDWIKMRVDLHDDPAVIAMAVELKIDEDAVVGKLHRIWSWADKHTIDGRTNGVTDEWLDRFVACKGCSAAMRKSGWLEIVGGFLMFPNFDRHNGKSAKSRAEATIRQRLSRNNRDNGHIGLPRVCTPAPFIRFVIERDGNRCAYCGTSPDRRNKLGADHIVPLTRGGKDAIENLISCCSKCNNEKNDRTPEEWGLIPAFLPVDVIYESQKICDRRVTETGPEKRREEKSVQPENLMGGKPPYPSEFEAVWQQYPKRSGNNPKADAFKCWSARVKEGVATNTMLDGLLRYATWCQATGKVGTETVMQACRFFGKSRPYEQPFDLPVDRKPIAQWWSSDAGIQAKAAELGMVARAGESWQQLKGRINERLGE